MKRKWPEYSDIGPLRSTIHSIFKTLGRAMSTTRQEALTIETPFGTAIVHDHRDHKTERENGTRAALHFEELTVNNKAYGSITLYLERRWNNPSVAPSSLHYRTVTDAARRKVGEYFVTDGQVIDILRPYMEPLDESSARQELKDRLTHQVTSGLYGAIERYTYRDVEGSLELAGELIDEILTEVQRKRQDGESYQNIYLKRD